MSGDPGFLKYKTFVLAHREANPQIINKLEQTRVAQDLWNPIKNDPVKQQELIFDFKAKVACREAKLMNYWGKVMAPSTSVSAKSPKPVIEKKSELAQTKNPDREKETSSKGKNSAKYPAE